MMVRGGAMSDSSPHSTQDTSALVVRIWNALGRGRRNDELLDGREFDPAKWEDAEGALESLLEQLETAHQALLEIQRTSTTGAAGNSTEYGQWVDEIVQAVLAANPASSPSKAAGGWCERHGGYLGQRCATCALEVADSAPARSLDA